MRFSEYLINLNEGNLGHTLEKGFDASSRGKEESSDIEVKPLKEWNAPTIDESYRPGEAYNYGRDEEDEKEEPVEWDGKGKPPPGWVDKEEEKAYLARRRSKKRRGGRRKSGRRSSDLQNDSLEIPMRDALGRLSIYSINEGVAHMKRQLKSKNITAAEKRKIQQKLHDKETRDRPRQLARAGDSETPLDIAVNAADRASESVTPAPKKQRVSTPDETAKNKKNAPKWVKKMSKKDRDARDANNVADAEMRAGGEGTSRQSHLDEPK